MMKNNKTHAIIGKKAAFIFKQFVLLSMLVMTAPLQGAASDGTWELSLGGGGYVTNVYYGSEEMYGAPFPDVMISYTNGRFSSSVSFLEGLRLMYMNPEKNFFAGASLNNGQERNSEEYSGLGVSRDHSDRVRRLLKGTPDVSTDMETGLLFGYMNPLGIFSLSFEYHPITQKMEGENNRTCDGFTSSVSYTKPVSVTKKLTVTTRLAVDLMDKNYANAWFSVEKPTQALTEFNADAGIRDVELAIQIDYRFSEHISARFLAQNALLLMDAADSPYTTSKYQVTSGLYGIYTF